MRVRIVVPSAWRPTAQAVLQWFPEATVVVPHDQREDYVRVNPGADIIALPKSCPAGLGASRDWIANESGIGCHIQIDDDIPAFVVMSVKTRKLTGAEFQAVCDSTASAAEDGGYKMFSFNHSPNPMNFEPVCPFKLTGEGTSTGMGFLPGHGIRIKPAYWKLHEDRFVWLMNAYLNRVIFRDMRYAPIQPGCWTNPGGVSAHRNREAMDAAARELVKDFGDTVELTAGDHGLSPKVKIPF